MMCMHCIYMSASGYVLYQFSLGLRGAKKAPFWKVAFPPESYLRPRLVQTCDLSAQGQLIRLGGGSRSAHLDSAWSWTRALLSPVQHSIARLILPGCSAQGFFVAKCWGTSLLANVMNSL